MASALFEIVWDDELGPNWMNADNLFQCLSTEGHIGDLPIRTTYVREIDVVPPPPTDSQYGQILKEFAARIVRKMLEARSGDMTNVENFWINEYADLLYIQYPGVNCLADLVRTVNTMKEEGVRIQINNKMNVDCESPTLVITE